MNTQENTQNLGVIARTPEEFDKFHDFISNQVRLLEIHAGMFGRDSMTPMERMFLDSAIVLYRVHQASEGEI